MRRLLPSLVLVLGTVPALAAIPDTLVLAPFADGFARTVALRHAGDGSGRVFLVQQDGQVIALSAGGSVLGTVLDVSSGAPHGFTGSGSHNERGLLGLAFHPDYPHDPRLFVYYTDGNGDTVVASWDLPAAAASASNPEVLLRVDQDFANHNGGDLHFGPDGYLYISLGDGGSGGDPCNRAQTLDPGQLQDTGGGCAVDAPFLTAPGSFPGNPDSRALLGKILRIDVDGSSPAGSDTCGGNANGSAPYAIPPGNPFAGGGTADGCGEVWHYGLRNPYRFSFDRLTGDLLIGDVGQDTWEEINFAAAGQGGINFGWRVCEGNHPPGQTGGSCGVAGLALPSIEYRTGVGGTCAVTGGFVYRGPITALRGDYVFADYCNGVVQVASGSGGALVPVVWQDTPYNVSGFGEDEAGNVYLLGLGGQVLRFETDDTLFRDGFESP